MDLVKVSFDGVVKEDHTSYDEWKMAGEWMWKIEKLSMVYLCYLMIMVVMSRLLSLIVQEDEYNNTWWKH